MKKIVVSILFVLFLIVGCSKNEQKLDNSAFLDKALECNTLDGVNSKLDKYVTIKETTKFKDGTSKSKNSIAILNNKGTLIKIGSSADKNVEGDGYYNYNKDNTIDMYTFGHNSSSKNNYSLNVSKNIPYESMKNIFKQFLISDPKKEKFTVIKDEKINGIDTVKIKYTVISENFLDGYISDGMLSQNDADNLKKNKDFNNAIMSIEKNDMYVYYWIDKNTYKIMKTEINNSAMETVHYYLQNFFDKKNENNPPVHSVTTYIFDYDNVKKIKLPEEK
ncbi:hypothetical protein [Peptostreptococcus faecalis]|uniref:hypothetical protein n=1 Tax=Peptostreptococcus faecalis TaxID=2045015 RepID=UPI000C7D5A14|nr:hypothetical protein [Peptostreptococcus faecalis]